MHHFLSIKTSLFRNKITQRQQLIWSQILTIAGEKCKILSQNISTFLFLTYIYTYNFVKLRWLETLEDGDETGGAKLSPDVVAHGVPVLGLLHVRPGHGEDALERGEQPGLVDHQLVGGVSRWSVILLNGAGNLPIFHPALISVKKREEKKKITKINSSFYSANRSIDGVRTQTLPKKP